MLSFRYTVWHLGSKSTNQLRMVFSTMFVVHPLTVTYPKLPNHKRQNRSWTANSLHKTKRNQRTRKTNTGLVPQANCWRDRELRRIQYGKQLQTLLSDLTYTSLTTLITLFFCWMLQYTIMYLCIQGSAERASEVTKQTKVLKLSASLLRKSLRRSTICRVTCRYFVYFMKRR